MRSIQDIIKTRLAELKLNPAQFSEMLGHKSNGLVAYVLVDKRKVPLNKIDDWTNILELSEADAKELRDLVELTHSPLGVRRRVYKLVQANAELFRVCCTMAARVYPQATDGELHDMFAKIDNPAAFRDAWVRLAERHQARTERS